MRRPSRIALYSTGQAQTILQIDADSAIVAEKATMANSAIAEKGHFWMETNKLQVIDFREVCRSIYGVLKGNQNA